MAKTFRSAFHVLFEILLKLGNRNIFMWTHLACEFFFSFANNNCHDVDQIFDIVLNVCISQFL